MKRSSKVTVKAFTHPFPRRIPYANVRATLIACHYINTFFVSTDEPLTKLPVIGDDELAVYRACKIIKPSSAAGRSIIEVIQNYSTDLSDMKKQGVVIIGGGLI